MPRSPPCLVVGADWVIVTAVTVSEKVQVPCVSPLESASVPLTVYGPTGRGRSSHVRR